MGLDRADVIWQRWREQLERITQETYRLHHYRQLWRELAEITQAANLPPSVFFDALPVWYVSTQGAAVRRQLDRTRGTVSLIRLLDDIQQNPGVVTRDRHIAAWCGQAGEPAWGDGAADAEALRDELRLRDANRNFDRFAGAGRDTIDRALVRADVAELERAGEVVKRYVDQAVAHTALNPERSVPTYGDLNAAMDRVAELVAKYASLLNAEILWGFEPAIQEDWKAPFRQAWIAADAGA
jgi:hypothetical protein